MKHLRSFNEGKYTPEETKEIFKDKINYQFINDVLRIVMPYEDKGYEFSYKVCHVGSTIPVLTGGSHQRDAYAKTAIYLPDVDSIYKRIGLIYVFLLSNPDNKYEDSQKLLKGLIQKLQSKYTFKMEASTDPTNKTVEVAYLNLPLPK